MIVLFIASNPSRSSPTNEPMHCSTRSRQILNGWLKDLDIQPIFINLIDQPTDKNKPLKIKEVKPLYGSIKDKIERLKYDAIVTLGYTSNYVLTDLNIKHTSIPHPSTRNRSLNDGKKIEDIKNKLRVLVESFI